MFDASVDAAPPPFGAGRGVWSRPLIFESSFDSRASLEAAAAAARAAAATFPRAARPSSSARPPRVRDPVAVVRRHPRDERLRREREARQRVRHGSNTACCGVDVAEECSRPSLRGSAAMASLAPVAQRSVLRAAARARGQLTRDQGQRCAAPRPRPPPPFKLSKCWASGTRPRPSLRPKYRGWAESCVRDATPLPSRAAARRRGRAARAAASAREPRVDAKATSERPKHSPLGPARGLGHDDLVHAQHRHRSLRRGPGVG